MMTTYDAGAVAEVLGLVPDSFIQPLDAARSRSPHALAARKPAARGSEVEGSEPYGLREEHTPLAGDLLTPMSAVAMEAAVEDGLPRSALRHVAEWLAGGDATKVAPLEWTVVPKTTLDRRNGKLSVPESERTERIARLTVQARRALGTDDEARAFMTAPHPELGGRTPVESARTDLGARRTETILLALEFGLAL